MWFIVDIPKPGFGNTNDGNIDIAAEITNLDYNLIYLYTHF